MQQSLCFECLNFVPFCSVPFLFPTLAFVCSYMVLHAQPARMFAQVSFISDFLGDADLIELTGFYLTSLTVCTCSLLAHAPGCTHHFPMYPYIPACAGESLQYESQQQNQQHALAGSACTAPWS